MLRLFADDYSATNQMAWKQGRRGTGKRHWKNDYLGQLRFDSLVAPTLVIPDSHLFDGPFFLTTSPGDLREQLGRVGEDGVAVLPFEVRGRDPSLAESLRNLLRRDDRDTLNSYPFKALHGDDADRVRPLLAEELGRTSESTLDASIGERPDDPVGAVLKVLRDAIHRVDPGLNADVLLGQLEEGWKVWLEQADQVPVEAYPKYTDFDVASALKREPLKPRTLKTGEGRQALADVKALVAAGSKHRSDISEVITQHRAADNLPDREEDRERVLRDLDLVDIWYSRGRYRALCERHGCACVQRDRPWLPPFGVGELLLREILGQNEPRVPRAEMPKDVLTRLADLPGEDFMALRAERRRALLDWWVDGDLDGLKRIAESLASIGPEPSRRGLGVAQIVPAPVTAASGLAIHSATGDPQLSATVGAFIGAASSYALSLLPGEPERLRMRVQEALRDRARGD